MKHIYTYDAGGWYTGFAHLNDSDLSPLEPDVYLIPGNAIELQPPEPTGGRWPRMIDGAWTLADRESGEAVEIPEASALLYDLRATLTAEYERRMAVISTGYPPSERESWPVQTEEAKALLADSQATTPWIDAAASARGIDRFELAQRIASKDVMYRAISGTLSGVRQRIEDSIDAAGEDVGALQAIDVAAGWPEGA